MVCAGHSCPTRCFTRSAVPAFIVHQSRLYWTTHGATCPRRAHLSGQVPQPAGLPYPPPPCFPSQPPKNRAQINPELNLRMRRCVVRCKLAAVLEIFTEWSCMVHPRYDPSFPPSHKHDKTSHFDRSPLYWTTYCLLCRLLFPDQIHYAPNQPDVAE
jgi:hypothetical protein